MLNSLKIKLGRWLLHSSSDEPEKISIGSQRGRILDNDRNAVNFTIHHASGGYVVETNYYDKRNDNHLRSLHIITSQEDFSEELGKAVFMEMLKNR